MKFIKDIASQFVSGLAAVGHKTMPDYNFLETAERDVLVAKDGSLGTILRIDGISRLMGVPELNALVSKAAMSFAPYLEKPGHAIQVYFCRNPDHSRAVVRKLMVESRSVARSLDLSGVDDLFDEKEVVLPRFIVDESFYIVLWTRMALLSKAESARVKEDTAVPDYWPVALDVQNVFKKSSLLATSHNAFVQSFSKDLTENGIRSVVLDGHDAIAAVRESIYPDLRGSTWRPILPGDNWLDAERKVRAPWMRPTERENDMSSLLWPRLDDQLFADGAEIVNSKIVRIGTNHFCGVDMTIGQQQLSAFTRLLNRMRDSDPEFPWRVSFLIESDGLAKFRMKKQLASIAAITRSENKQIANSIKAMEAAQAQGSTIVRMRTSFSTWAPVSAGLRVMEDRANALQKSVEAWGNTQTSATAGDPLAGALSSVLGLDIRSTAPAGCMPLEACLSQLPWMRDASPFPSGSVLFRTPDGRPWVFDPGSSLRDAFIDIIYAVSGRGKSVLLSSINFAFCMSRMATSGQGGAKLPLVRIIDIGPSSGGFISLLKESLPPARRHEAAHITLHMKKEHAINPMDLPLMCRTPTSQDRNFIVNFLTALGTPEGHPTPAHLSDLVGAMVDELFKKYSDRNKKGSPRSYVRGTHKAVDEALDKLGVEKPAIWWKVVDTLFHAGDTHLASVAQRYAVPRLEDLMSLDVSAVKDIFGNATVHGSSQTLMDSFRMMVSTAVREYPILANPTAFDLGEARVVALDLDAVTSSGGGAAGDKRAALMYMLGRFILTRDFYHNERMLNEFEEDSRHYHADRIRRIRETPKRVVFDEFHRTSVAPAVRAQVKQDMREGRKWDVQIALASQLLGDFDADMLDMASGVWLLGANSQSAVDDAIARFDLSTSAGRVMRSLEGPGPTGAPFLVLLKLKGGAHSQHEHHLYNTLGPQEAWAFSTTPNDTAIRSRLYAVLGPVEARRRLAKRFPSGGAKAEVERRNRDKIDAGLSSLDSEQSVIDEIANELISGLG